MNTSQNLHRKGRVKKWEFSKGNSILTEGRELSRMEERLTVLELPSDVRPTKQELLSLSAVPIPRQEQPAKAILPPGSRSR